ncbi:MAG: nucleotidyltransferase family protein [Bacillota bacterium]|nr:nucleotidyltransferase family protein [Bacillota bacterium]HHU60491.1 NTP transferase domain-containing protein [Natronincola sp.]
MKVDAVILAGAPNTGRLKDVNSEEWEASISIHGKPMINYVLDAVQGAQKVEKIVVVGPAELKSILPADIPLVLAGDSITENIFRSLDALEQKNKIMVVTSDIPFIHAEALDDFILRCLELDSDIFYPLISKEANEQVYPKNIRTYFTLKEGTFTGGNIIMATPAAIHGSRWIMDQVISERKRPWKIIKMLGFMFILKFITKQLSLREIEMRASEVLGYSGTLIISPYPELGTDIDKPSDLALAEQMITPA